jgi:hypothetical protein
MPLLRAPAILGTTCAAAVFALPTQLAANDPQAEPVAGAQEQAAIGEEIAGLLEIEVLHKKPLKPRELIEAYRNLVQHNSIVTPAYRFVDSLCVRVAGLADEVAKHFEQRVMRNAEMVGLEQAEPTLKDGTCRTNALVLVTDEPARLFEKIASRRPELLGNIINRDVHSRRLRNELRERRPAVAWSLLVPSAPVGGTIDLSEQIPVTYDQRASRLNAPFTLVKQMAVVMLDAEQIAKVPLTQLADYVSMHVLASPRRDVGFAEEVDALQTPTILSLFEDGGRLAPLELTKFDRAYLRGVYTASPGRFSNRLNSAVVKAYRSIEAEDAAQAVAGVSQVSSPGGTEFVAE